VVTKADRRRLGLLPICVAHPRRVITVLAAAGYDATQGRSLIAVPAPDSREELDPVTARKVLESIVYLPCYSEMTPAAVERLARLVAAIVRDEVAMSTPKGVTFDSPGRTRSDRRVFLAGGGLG
jgi:hypothetical protein